jgi:hypothetical protein
MLLALFMILTVFTVGQELRLLPYTVSGQFLNDQIVADTTANGKLPDRVYVLQRGGLYLSRASFANTGNWTLRLKANDSTTTRPPVIMLHPTGTGGSPFNPPGNLFSLQGSLSLKGLLITGYYELADTNLRNLQGSLITVPSTTSGITITIDSCILSNTNGNHVRTDGAVQHVKITNSIFANMGYLGRSNLGAGKGIDLRDVACDSLIMENNTFVNWLDRIVRHYPAGSATSTGVLKYFRFNHNTVINGGSYHGMLSLGSVGDSVVIKNNLFYDPHIFGNDTDYVRQVEFLPSGEKNQFGGNRITWIFSYPNQTTTWKISHNYYAISDSVQKFYTDNASVGVTGEGSPLTWHINGRLGADSVNAFKKVSVKFNKVPKSMTTLARWYRLPTGGNKSKNTPGAWVYGPSTSPYADPNDYDRKSFSWLRDSLNASYSGPSTIVSSDGKVVGDPRWSFTTGITPTNNTVPNVFSLDQNYPNPFNPSTSITYSIPVNGMVSLKVYNLIGQEVATLVNEIQHAASYGTSFDASKLSSGIYFYTLRAGNFVQTKKMMLVK